MAADYDVKIFGERNTSTNALDRIIRSNSASVPAPSVADAIDPGARRRIKAWDRLGRLGPARPFAYRMREATIDRVFRAAPDSFAWKHAATRFGDMAAFDGLAVLVTVRNPASWVQSLCKNPYHIPPGQPRDLGAFLDHGWPTVGRERLEGRVFRPLDLYAEKLRSYLAFFDQLEHAGIPWRIVPFETLVTDQPSGFAAIRDLLRDPAETFEPLQSSTKSGSKSLDWYRDHYGNERWRDGMGAVYDRVRREFPETLAGEFGYRL